MCSIAPRSDPAALVAAALLTSGPALPAAQAAAGRVTTAEAPSSPK